MLISGLVSQYGHYKLAHLSLMQWRGEGKPWLGWEGSQNNLKFNWEFSFKRTMKEWHRMGDAALWKGCRPGPNPIKACGNPFEGIVPGADDPQRIKPDLVHTFHIGFGADMCASMIVWLSMKGRFGLHTAFDDRLLAAYSEFQSFCHTTHRYTACEEWSKAALGMSGLLAL